MKKRIINGTLEVPAIGIGCMRMENMQSSEAGRVVRTAMEHGMNFFDHADVYGMGVAEEVFAKGAEMTSDLREKMILQSKCGIRKDGIVRYDFSKEYIVDSVDKILKRLNTDYLDILLLHRPDTLVEPEEVAAAFDQLEMQGKVRDFGVSNQSPMLMELLGKYVNQKLIVNQLQFSLAHTPMIDRQIYMNTGTPGAISRDSEVLEYCRLKDITIQAWSPFQYGFFEGSYIGNKNYAKLNAALERIALEKGVSVSAVVIAWILRHPAKIQPIIGTMNVKRIAEISRAADIEMTRSEWYELYSAAGNDLP